MKFDLLCEFSLAFFFGIGLKKISGAVKPIGVKPMEIYPFLKLYRKMTILYKDVIKVARQ